MNNMVYLVGAGPGDPGLLTLKGRAVIERADVIVYDQLANPALLGWARNDAEIIYVGKHAGDHTLPQGGINALLVEKAREGKVVCRLKGGDPYIFGRGSEEALALVEAGITVEVVPGITAASAVSAYAGIPLTHRGLCTGVSFITGHEDPTKDHSTLNWDGFASGSDTLVFYMGVKNLPKIAGELISRGRDPHTPAALIREGTLCTQRTLTGTLEDIAARAVEAGITPPALLVVGEVIALRESINWFEQRPLFGTRVVVTRARAQAGEITSRLDALGSAVTEVPVIRIDPVADTAELDDALDRVQDHDWVVFTSVNGVEAVFERLHARGGDARCFGGVQCCAIGPATAERLLQYGIRADLVPRRFVAETLLEELGARNEIKDKSYLLLRADLARPDLARGLAEQGANVSEVTAYHTVVEQPADEVCADCLGADYVTFASSSTVRNFVEALGTERLESLKKQARFVSIGPVTSGTMKELGLPVHIEATQSTIPGMVQAILDDREEKK